MHTIKNWLKRLILQEKSSSEAYVRHMRKLGVQIGDYTWIIDPSRTFVDTTRPWLVTIGKNVKLARGVSIWTHGYDWCVLKEKYGDILGSCGPVTIGDNVFVGVNTTILKNVTIGNNVIISVNSLVTHDIPDNCVAGGSPCEVIMPIEKYYEKRQKAQVREAKGLARAYYARTGQLPPKEVFYEFFWLFEPHTQESLSKKDRETMEKEGSFEKSLERFLETEPVYPSYEAFLEDCGLNGEEKAL